jgi:hypothetical protein
MRPLGRNRFGIFAPAIPPEGLFMKAASSFEPIDGIAHAKKPGSRYLSPPMD